MRVKRLDLVVISLVWNRSFLISSVLQITHVFLDVLVRLLELTLLRGALALIASLALGCLGLSI